MKRIAVIDRNRCTREKCGYQCRLICPPVRMGDDAIVIDGKGWPVIDENLCTGCGLCPKRCPTGAIKVINLAGEAGDPLHQYGVNAFRIYNFAVPRENSVAALVGRNGIGKTTLLDILSGKLVPNFTDYSKTPTWNEAMPLIKRKDTRNYFEGIAGGRKVSYKPQNIEALARAAPNRTVGEALREFDERGAYDDLVESLNMRKFINSRLGELSGGELQKAAVAIAMLKDADLYFFDEPSTYLDIHERMRVADSILSLSASKPVMLVEHDLAVLDYLANYVYVLYGEPGAYGVVSGIKSARSGINEFMGGYLKDENVRFRDRGLVFGTHSTGEAKKGVLFRYGEMRKSFGRFTLSVEAGEARKGEVVGLVGPNAIGKSTFIKLIAGVEMPGEGGVGGQTPEVMGSPNSVSPAFGLAVSYKPQYITADFDGTVHEYITRERISAEYVKEFELDSIMFKPVKALSGGELQRLSIAHALSRDADIYLLDEPSAFLDIEQRMRLSTVIKRDIADKEKVAFVVDHDVVFIDSISSRLMHFTGESSVQGNASPPSGKMGAMNSFLSGLGITLRRDQETKRPKINKKDSVMDREQRAAGNYYYYSK